MMTKNFSMLKKSFILFICLTNSNIFIFLVVKRAANYAENGMVGKLEVDFQRVPLVQIF